MPGDANIEVARSQCPTCLDSGEDNRVWYEDGHSFCYACYTRWGKEEQQEDKKEEEIIDSRFIKGECKALPQRGISLATCQFMNYQVGRYDGTFGKGNNRRQCNNELVHIANYYDPGLVTQKIRSEFKEFTIRGDGHNMPLYGEWKWKPNPEGFIIVVEGEIDQMSLLEVRGTRWAVVSVPKGSGDARNSLEDRLPYLLGWGRVKLGLDNTKDGLKAMYDSVDLFEPGKVDIIKWTAKDANELLKAGRLKELESCIWQAEEVRPKRSVTVSDIWDRILTKPQRGLDFCWGPLTEWTYGLKGGEMYIFVGPEGVGKSWLIKDIVTHFIDKIPVGVFSFEQLPEDTIRRYIGAKIGVQLHKPGEPFNEELIRTIGSEYDKRIWLYDHKGKIDINDVLYTIRYWSKAKGVKLIIIDNLKQLNIVLNKEKLVDFLQALTALKLELGIDIMLVSHVSKNEIRQSTHVGFSSMVDKPHDNLSEKYIKDTMQKFKLTWETGRIAGCGDIEGGNDIAAYADYVISLFRNKESENIQERKTLGLMLKKCGRIDSEFAGKIMELYYSDVGALQLLSKKEVF